MDKPKKIGTVKTTDSELVQHCVTGEEWAWIALVDRYKALIYSIAIKCGINREMAGDIFQSVCYKLYKNLATLREQERLINWIVTTTTRECWRARSRYRYEVLVAEDTNMTEELAIDAVLPDTEILQYEQQVILHAAMTDLEPRCQRLLRLLFFEHESPSYENIGREMGMPSSSIGPTRARCLQKLKKILKERV